MGSHTSSHPSGNYTTYRVPRLRELRDAAGLTQADLAMRARCTRQNIWRWESGGGMTYRSLLRLAAALGAEAREIADYPLPPHVGRDAGRQTK